LRANTQKTIIFTNGIAKLSNKSQQFYDKVNKDLKQDIIELKEKTDVLEVDANLAKQERAKTALWG